MRLESIMELNREEQFWFLWKMVGTRLKLARKVVVGHWRDVNVGNKLRDWMKTAVGYTEGINIRVARFGDNMRNVAVTDGDKVEAHIKFGWTVDYYGIGDLVERINQVSNSEVEKLFREYQQLYDIETNEAEDALIKESILEQAKIEIGLKAFLDEGNYTAFTTNFEDLHGMKQLPGLAAQRLMAQGYGFAGEGDWRTAALLRLMKVISNNVGTSFMEDYTYHLEPGNEMILGSHMLEVCPTVAATRPKVVVNPLSMGGKEDPARLVFDGQGGDAINVSLIELGGKFRFVINEVKAEQPTIDTPNLPVAKVLWKPEPSLNEATESWIYAGGAHHTVFSYAVTTDQLYDFADMTGVECIIIDKDTKPRQLRDQLK